MESLSFVFGDRAVVPTYLGIDVQHDVLQHVAGIGADKILLVVDENIDALYADYFAPLSTTVDSAHGDVDSSFVERIVLPAGDSAKSWGHLTTLIQWLFKVGATKRSVVVAFGGGALLNVAGLFASIAFRGLKLIYVPTTMLAMHDVVTSLKTSICFDGRKNNVGSFYAPVKILIDVAFCRSLPKNELFSGLGELAKNAALFGGEHARGFISALSKEVVDAGNGGTGEELSIPDDDLLLLVRLGIKAKMDLLATDAYERTTAMIFEYGHTMSHALEKAYGDGVVPHGLGVTYGMLACSFAAERMGLMTAKAREEHDAICHLLVNRWALPSPLPTVDTVMSLAMKDSKRGITSEQPDEISDVFCKSVGDVVPSSTQMLHSFPAMHFRDWLESMGFPIDDACKA